MFSLQWERWLPGRTASVPHTKGFPVLRRFLFPAYFKPSKDATWEKDSRQRAESAGSSCWGQVRSTPHPTPGPGFLLGPLLPLWAEDHCCSGLGSVCIRPGWSLSRVPHPSAALTALLLPDALGARAGTPHPHPAPPPPHAALSCPSPAAAQAGGRPQLCQLWWAPLQSLPGAVGRQVGRGCSSPTL